MTTFWAPFDDLVDAVLDGSVADAPLVIAILVAQARGLAGSQRSHARDRAHHQVEGGEHR
jgi:ADP-ribose pyrophosphatase